MRDKPTDGERLRSTLIGQGSNRVKFATAYNDLPQHERDHFEQAAAEFATPYLARIAELEAANEALQVANGRTMACCANCGVLRFTDTHPKCPRGCEATPW